jgi:hypothetical protein
MVSKRPPLISGSSNHRKICFEKVRNVQGSELTSLGTFGTMLGNKCNKLEDVPVGTKAVTIRMSTQSPQGECLYKDCTVTATEENNRFCAEHSYRSATEDLEEYKIVVEKFNKELEFFWARATFYLLVQAGLLSVVVAILSASTEEFLVGVACLVGGVLAIFWFLVMRGTYAWICEWRKEAGELDEAVNRFQSLSTAEDDMSRKSNLLRPAYVTQYLPIVFIVAWPLLAKVVFPQWVIVVSLVVALIATISVWAFSRS